MRALRLAALACLLSLAGAPGTVAALQSTVAAPLQVRRVRVPRLLDLSQGAAEKLLADSGLQVGKVTPRASAAKPGTVIAQFPLAGAMVPRQSSVAITVARLGPAGVSPTHVMPAGPLTTVAPPPPPPPSIAVPPPVLVPQLVGLSVDHALGILEKLGLREAPRDSAESPLASGTVLAQKPDSGAYVVRGTPIQLQVAVPVRVLPVPSLIGRTPEAAAAILVKTGFELGEIHPLPRPDSIDVIVSQGPLAGTRAVRGTAVAVWIGAVEPGVAVPDLKDSTREAAEAALTRAGLTPGPVRFVRVVGAESTVVAQDPPAGTVVQRRTPVRTDIGVPVPPVLTVPPLLGRSRSEAIDTLRGRGLVPGRIDSVSGTGPPDMVISQVPPAGEPAKPGDTVAFGIGARDTAATPGVVPDIKDPGGTGGGGGWPWKELVIGSAVLFAAAGTTEVLRRKRIDRKWHARTDFRPGRNPRPPTLPDTTDPLSRPELSLRTGSGKLTSTIVGDGP